MSPPPNCGRACSSSGENREGATRARRPALCIAVCPRTHTVHRPRCAPLPIAHSSARRSAFSGDHPRTNTSAPPRHRPRAPARLPWPVRNNSRRDPYYRTNEYGHIQLSGTGTLDYHWIYWNSYLYTVSVPKSVPCSYPMRYTVLPVVSRISRQGVYRRRVNACCCSSPPVRHMLQPPASSSASACAAAPIRLGSRVLIGRSTG